MDHPSVPKEIDDVVPWIERALSRGVLDAKSAFHWPTLITTDERGVAQARTVVLRGFDALDFELTAFTDRRSQKVVEIERNPFAGMHVYDKATRVQLRLEGQARVECSGPAWEQGWQRASQGSLLDYQRTPGPGSPVHHLEDISQDVGCGKKNFALLRVRLRRVDYLHLGAERHRRACFSIDNANVSGEWLVP